MFQHLFKVLFSSSDFQKIVTRFYKLTTDADQYFNCGDKIDLKRYLCESCCLVYLPVNFIRARISLYLYRPEESLCCRQYHSGAESRC